MKIINYAKRLLLLVAAICSLKATASAAGDYYDDRIINLITAKGNAPAVKGYLIGSTITPNNLFVAINVAGLQLKYGSMSVTVYTRCTTFYYGNFPKMSSPSETFSFIINVPKGTGSGKFTVNASRIINASSYVKKLKTISNYPYSYSYETVAIGGMLFSFSDLRDSQSFYKDGKISFDHSEFVGAADGSAYYREFWKF